MHLPRRRRLQRNRIIFLLAIMLVLSLYQLQFRPSAVPAPPLAPQAMDPVKVTSRDIASNRTAVTGNVTAPPKIRHCVYVDSEPIVPITTSVSTTPQQGNGSGNYPDEKPPYESKGEYPQDLFSVEERRQGWVVLHIFGMMYVFVALAIVCDEYFVPALGVITEKLQISEDVAGATFMAAGGSAPELFTSLIGVFISHSNVGIGTIVGSAVFNILFVIGTCALFSREILHLTWWPLFRDISFYIVDLLMLILFFLDSVIDWWESLLLLTAYATYVFTMKYNVHLEQWVKQELSKKLNAVQAATVEHIRKKSTGAVADDGAKKPADGRRLQPGSALQRGSSSASLHNTQMRSTVFQLMIHTLDPLTDAKFKDRVDILSNIAKAKAGEGSKPEAEEEKAAPSKVQVTPASDSEAGKDKQKADAPQDAQVGETIGISEEIMGLTILAAGTSIPDLITSVIVARKGLGDMAVSSSVGSNIFDITVGLPVPWFLYSVFNELDPVAVSSNGLFCAIVLLFLMLLFVIISIAACKWKMNKLLGLTMFALYFVFLIISVMLEDKIISCPVSV
ncbi:sodium/potassium/calcium exchanger 1 isoform X4 [Pezoporus wallicus]|uniref:sodium/potassium/calcium exchanger 1 isoform X4 n=1 Tax=Pezoporus wallicus TaxID=35540 RepID=UPI00254C9553|nr:sodium/potassium/calcium exchanger 1 isoform X4 [Pezoporus wallicus]XP_061302585.1 sodium/potassium/calcium exchanger 1 isoform X4 [Pezoporus flaviventris]